MVEVGSHSFMLGASRELCKQYESKAVDESVRQGDAELCTLYRDAWRILSL